MTETKQPPATTSQPGEARPRQPTARLNPLDALDTLLQGVVGLTQTDAEYLVPALAAYSLAVATKHPYANTILEHMIQRYAGQAEIELPSGIKYEGVNPEGLLQPFGELMGRYSQQASLGEEGSNGGERYGSRQ